MKDMDPLVFLAVFEEMLGPWLWVLIALAVVGLLALIRAIIVRRGIDARLMLVSQIIGIAGGFASIGFMWWITNSSMTDIGGAIDLLLVMGIWLGGFLGGLILAYGMLGMLYLNRKKRPV